MNTQPQRNDRTAAIRTGIVAVCAALAVGAWMLRPENVIARQAALPPAVHPVLPAATLAPLPIIGAAPVSRSVPPPVGMPVRLRIPKIGVDTALQHLGLEDDGTMQPPSQWGVAGWYDRGPRPGAPGPAVIVGHIDSTSGPAVFYRLRDLSKGDDVLVTAQGGRVLRFVVDEIAAYPKAHFPTWRVYGPQPLPVLRLITCTGAFDSAARSYLDNLVVYAHLG